MAKVFKFAKNKVKDLSKNEEALAEVIQCGKDKFTLKDFKLQYGHDDSLPYHAILCLNGEPLCTCFNDGWGGETNLTALSPETSFKMNCLNVSLKDYKWGYRNTEFALTLDFIADTLACTAELMEKVLNKK